MMACAPLGTLARARGKWPLARLVRCATPSRRAAVAPQWATHWPCFQLAWLKPARVRAALRSYEAARAVRALIVPALCAAPEHTLGLPACSTSVRAPLTLAVRGAGNIARTAIRHNGLARVHAAAAAQQRPGGFVQQVRFQKDLWLGLHPLRHPACLRALQPAVVLLHASQRQPLTSTACCARPVCVCRRTPAPLAPRGRQLSVQVGRRVQAAGRQAGAQAARVGARRRLSYPDCLASPGVCQEGPAHAHRHARRRRHVHDGAWLARGLHGTLRPRACPRPTPRTPAHHPRRPRPPLKWTRRTRSLSSL